MSKNKLQVVVPPKKDAFTRISQFMTGKAVVLSADEETILNRWITVDKWLRQNKHTTDEICALVEKDFSVSKFTALNDIRNTQKLFALARSVNKKYVGHIHLERINKDIEDMRDRIFYQDGPVDGVKVARVPDAKEMVALARLHEAYTDALNKMPEDAKKDVMPPPIFNFNLVGGEVTTTMTLPDALNAADEMLNGTGDYIDHEVVPPAPDDTADE